MSKLDGPEVGFHIVRQSRRCIGPTGSIELTEMLVMADFKARWMK